MAATKTPDVVAVHTVKVTAKGKFNGYADTITFEKTGDGKNFTVTAGCGGEEVELPIETFEKALAELRKTVKSS
jgi:hypothetical protein